MADNPTEIVFDDDDDMVFLGENIFGHDFIHDFNTANFSERLAKIGSRIDAIQKYFVLTGGGNLLQRGEDHDDQDPNIPEEELLEHQGFDLQDDAILRIREKIKFVQQTTMMTRSKTSNIEALQNALNLVHETKLFVMGFFNTQPHNTYFGFLRGVPVVGPVLGVFGDDGSVGSKVSSLLKKGGRETIMMEQDPRITAETMPGKMDYNVKPIHNVKGKITNRISSDKFHKSFYECVRNAFDCAINDEQNSPELKAYFEFMKKIYLCYENTSIHPFKAFNNTYITEAMLVYIIDKTEVDTDDKIHNVLNSLAEPEEITIPETFEIDGGKKMIGGVRATLEVIESLKNKIADECDELFGDLAIINEPFFDELVTRAENYHNEIQRIKNGDNNDLNNFVAKMKRAKSYNDLINKNNLLARTSLTARTRPNMVKELPSFLRAYIVNDIHNSIDKFLDRQDQILARFNADTGPLTNVQKHNVQQISCIVAAGALDFIGEGGGDRDHSLLEKQEELLQNIVSRKGIGTADAHILQAFKDYVGAGNYLSNETEMNSAMSVVRTTFNQGQIRAINNAASKALTNIGIRSNQIYCPNSSIVDAMGTFGSCSGTNNVRENYSTTFTLRNRSGTKYYNGNSIYNDANRTLLVNYSAQINNFNLPYVEKKIDLRSTKHVTVFSANTTFMSVIDKILKIWLDNIPMGEVLPSPETFWGLLGERHVYADLVSIGSLKSVGDLYQEINSTALNGAYTITDANVARSFRIGAMGDQPSGVRAGFILKNASSGTHPTAMAGYFDQYSGTNYAVIKSRLPPPAVPQRRPAAPAPAPVRRRGGKTKKRTKHNKKQSRKLKA